MAEPPFSAVSFANRGKRMPRQPDYRGWGRCPSDLLIRVQLFFFLGFQVFFLSPVMRKGRCTIISESSAASFGNSRHFVGPVSFFVPKKTDLATGFRMIVTRVPAVFTGAPHKP